MNRVLEPVEAKREKRLKRRSPWAVLSGALVVLLAVTGLQSGLQASAAHAGPNDFGLVVDNGGVTSVSAYTDQLTYETRVVPQSGVPVKPGAVTKITLDRSLKMSSLGSVPAGSGATQKWDEKSNTLTVTWGELFSGTTYGITIVATPSGIATSSDTFQTTAVTSGFAPDNTPLTQTATSAPIAVTGSTIVAPGVIPQPQAGDWELSVQPTSTVNPGNANYGSATFRPVGGTKTAFQNLQFVTTWGVPFGTDEKLPSAWVTEGMRIDPSFVSGETLQDNPGVDRVYSYGSFGGNVNGSVASRFRALVPAGTAPGRYSVPFQIVDSEDGGATRRVIVSSAMTVVVPEPVATAADLNAMYGPNQVVAGRAFDWGQRLSMSLPGGTVKNLTVTAAVPDGVIVQGISGQFSDGTTRVDIKKVEYTTDPAANAASIWQNLPRTSAGSFSLPDNSVIRGIRYVINDTSTRATPALSPIVFSLQAKDSLAPGAQLSLVTKSMEFLDPVAGQVSVDPTPQFTKVVTVVASSSTSPSIAAADTPSSNGLVNYDQTYSNGNSFGARYFLASTGDTALEKPYMFVVVPKGMSTSGMGRDVCSPYTWPYQHGGCTWGPQVTFPRIASDSGSVTLSNGSTLYYSRVTEGEIRAGAGATPMQQLHSLTTMRVNSMLAGTQKVLVGMGSLSDDSFTVDTSKNQNARYGKKSLSVASSYGTYAEQAVEIRSVLAGVGVETDNVLMGERSFTVAPSTSVGSVTTIKGSEDAAGIVQGAGTATARPGGSVAYQVVVSNTGAAIYKDFEFIDVLPAVGDTYTLNPGVARESAFDVNLSGNVKVLVNGAPSAGAVVEYTTSATPARFDGSGADVPGDAWLPFTGAATGAKALRVKLASGVEFAPGDKITLSFDGTVPASAPRDGSTAKNSVAYRFKTPAGVLVASEAPAVPVKSSAPTGDTQLSGLSFLDVNGNGIQDAGEPGLNGAGVSLQLYKVVSGNPVAVGSPVNPNTDAGVVGTFTFIGIDPNVTYKIKPASSNADITFPAEALDADGFLKYLRVSDAAANGSENTSQYVGSSVFKVGDEVGVKKWVKDLRLPLVAKTTVAGDLQFTDVTNTPLTAGTGSMVAPYVKGYTVKLMQGGTEKASTTTDETGGFAFTGVEGLTPGNYTLLFQTPSGGKLVASALNNPSVFSGAATPSADGVYKLDSLQPGVPATVHVYYTDTGAPTASTPNLTGGVTLGSARVNPQSVALAGTDAETRVKSYGWRVLDSASAQLAGASVNVNTGESPAVTVPTTLADGSYTVEVTATDVAGNVSAAKSVAFSIDKTAPVVTSASTAVTFAKGSPAAPTTSQGWIDLYGVTATDSGVGIPASGGITVDASDVNTGTAGTYRVKFTAQDAAGNTAAVYATDYVVVYVADPTITLGQNSANYEMGGTPPATDAAWKALFGGVTTGTSGGATVASVVVDAAAADDATAGSYPVVFTVTDSLGYTASVTGTLVVRDTTKPAITTTETALTFRDGDAQINTDADWIAAYGVTATDTGSGIASLTVDSSGVDYAAAGTYAVTFTATDHAGNAQTSTVEYTVAFAGAPSITLGTTQVVYEMGDNKPKTQAEWIVLFDAAATSAPGTTVKSLTVDHSAVDFETLSAVGYDVVFTATDSYNNVFSYTGKYIVQDTKKPTARVEKDRVKHKQEVPVTAYTTAEWLSLFGVTATDTAGGSGIDADAWQVVEGVNFTVAGEYEVEFTAYDRAGNASKTVTATLTVQAPPTGDQVSMKVAQNKGVVLSPNGRSTTTGSLEALTPASLGDPSAGGAVKLNGIGGVEYTPAKDYSGEETLVVTVTDDLGQTAEIVYTFTVVKKGKTIPENLPEYNVPVDGTLTIPVADVLQAVDVQGLVVDQLATTNGFVGKVKLDRDQLKFTTGTGGWHGDETFTVKLKDELGQIVEVPVLLHVLAPTITANEVSGYAGVSELKLDLKGLVPNQTYALELHSKPLALGTVTASEAGSAQLVVTVPAEAEVGLHKVVLLNAAAQERGSVGFEVLNKNGGPRPVTPEPTGEGLSQTGGDPLGRGALVGIPLLLAGGLLLLGAARLRKRTRGARSGL